MNASQRLRAQRDRLREQRDMLAAALSVTVTWMEQSMVLDAAGRDALRTARTALAKVRP